MIDVLSFFDEYPFRRLPKTGLGDISRDLCELGFEKIIAVSFKVLFYRDVYEADREILERNRDMVKSIKCPKIFIALGANPEYTVFPKDLLKEKTRRIFVLAPAYQGFRLDSGASIRFLEGIAENESRIIIIDLLEDYREFHRGYRLRYLIKHEYLENFLRRIDRSLSKRVILAGFRYDLLQRVFKEISEKEILVDVSSDTLYGPQYDRVRELVSSVGDDLVVLGTRYPIANPLASVLRVLFSDLSERSKEKILRGNAEKFLEEIYSYNQHAAK